MVELLREKLSQAKIFCTNFAGRFGIPDTAVRVLLRAVDMDSIASVITVGILNNADGRVGGGRLGPDGLEENEERPRAATTEGVGGEVREMW